MMDYNKQDEATTTPNKAKEYNPTTTTSSSTRGRMFPTAHRTCIICCILLLSAVAVLLQNDVALNNSNLRGENPLSRVVPKKDNTIIVNKKGDENETLHNNNIFVRNSTCTSHIKVKPDKKYGSTLNLKKSCKFLPGPDVVASQCPNFHQVEHHIDSFVQEQNNVQRYVMVLASAYSAHSRHALVGSLLDAHPMMLVSTEADIFSRWLGTNGRNYDYRGALPTKDKMFDEIFSNSLKCALYTRWQNGYNYTVPGGWGGQWIPGKLAVIGDKGDKTMMRLEELHSKSKTYLVEAFRDFQRTIGGLPIHIVHVYWEKDGPFTRRADELIDILRSSDDDGPTTTTTINFSVFEFDNTIYACGDNATRLALLTNACKFLGVPCDSVILDIWNSMAKCKYPSKHIPTS